MTLYGLRLLVALLTFAVGVAAAWLLHFESPTRSQTFLTYETAKFYHAPSRAAPRRACSSNKPRVVSGGLLQNKAVSKPKPVYPPLAKAMGVSGTVTVQVEVDEGGAVRKAEAVSGPDLLRGVSEAAAMDALFSPTLLSGQPVRVSGVITYNFVLQ